MFTWPVAAVLLGALATFAVGLMRWVPLARRGDCRCGDDNGRVWARATDLAEIGARLTALEAAHHTLRAELRADMRELQSTIREVIAHRSH